MAARIIELAEVRARRNGKSAEPSRDLSTADFTDRFHFWSGASGRRYVHTIYSLIECPTVSAGNYLLVHREADGRRRVLAVGRATHAAPCLNLAEIRHRGALLGANEVHVHLLADSAKQARLVELDLRSANLPPEDDERTLRTRH
jgi:hypothetical protein